MVVRNDLEHGIPGFERIALKFSAAAAEKKNGKGKLQKTSDRSRKYSMEILGS
jgi:hypothetical protein